MLDSRITRSRPRQWGHDFELMLDVFRQHAPPFQSKLIRAAEPFKWSGDAVRVANGVGAWRLEHNGHTTMSSETDGDRLYVVFPQDGAFRMKSGRNASTASSGMAMLVSTPLFDRAEGLPDTMHSCFSLQFDEVFVRRILGSLFHGVSLSQLGLSPLIDLNSDFGRVLQHLVNGLCCSLYDSDLIRRSPNALALLSESILRLILENVPHNYHHRLEQRLLCASPQHVQNAIAFMHEHLHCPLTMADVAEFCGVSVRCLQASFRQYQDTTPMLYLRQLRLEAVRAELLSEVNILSISDVAAKWGFSHMGRFSILYRATYGEKPSDTVRGMDSK